MSEKFADDHKIETYKSMISISVEAFKLLALLNGGAVAGIIAAYEKVRAAVDPGSLKLAICLFVAGLITDGCAFVSSYLTQNVLFNELSGDRIKDSHIVHIKWTFAFVMASLGCFSAGALIAAFNVK
ncbi:hypothetical protein [Paraburkholderia dipogonis]|uniref:hypothetical protein n=1 Tax=Paraburkholderia dipogonis TaxID=1211383 RepID=UPI0038BBBAB5